MVWMLNDCWPTSNWSIIDYYRRPKPAYYAAKRACATLLPIVFERRENVEFFFSNDGGTPCEAKLRFGQLHLNGDCVWTEEQSVPVGPVETVRFHTVNRTDLSLYTGDYLFVEADIGGTRLPIVTYFPDLWKEVPWPRPDVHIRLEGRTEGENGVLTRLEVETDSFARFCHLLIPKEAGVSWLDDNFFDLPAGMCHGVSVFSAASFPVEKVKIGTWHTDWP